ncbi:MAG: Rieske 2Fe-2S domain-containing protein [Zoogloeaceae bacterium]|nr:Rieske 2Fe-2S domain-containing protein [Zoogloeaceae bacterium]
MESVPAAPRFPICASAVLAEGRHIKVKLRFEGRREECLLVRYRGQAYGYVNRCVHMPRPLDCEKDLVFDATGRYLRCSMHGIVYAPDTGASVSALCEGERLRAVALYEEDGVVGIADFRVSAVTGAVRGAPPA